MKYVDPRLPKYQDGMRVRALIDLHNDGSHPNFPPDSLLVATGMQGEIINVDYVVRILPLDEHTCSIMITEGTRSVPIAVKGTPTQIATARRIFGK